MNTVADVAGRLKIDVALLLQNIHAAGLPQTLAEEEFSNSDMQILQVYLKGLKEADTKSSDTVISRTLGRSTAGERSPETASSGTSNPGLAAPLTRRTGTLSVQRKSAPEVKVATVKRRRIVKPSKTQQTQEPTPLDSTSPDPKTDEEIKQTDTVETEKPTKKTPAKTKAKKSDSQLDDKPKESAVPSQLTLEKEKIRAEEETRRKAEGEIRRKKAQRQEETRLKKEEERQREEQQKQARLAEEAARKAELEEKERIQREAEEVRARAEAEAIATEKSGAKRSRDEKGAKQRGRTLEGKALGRRRSQEKNQSSLGLRRRRKAALEVEKQGGEFSRPVQKIVREVEVSDAITVGELARRMSVKAGEVIKALMDMGEMVTINQTIDQDTAVLVIEEMGHKVKLVASDRMEEELVLSQKTEGEPEPRPPVVTVMGHVDHGKTSLLDYIRSAHVVSEEQGGITQHIGAYHVTTKQGAITFLDTPGHAAFSAMRARGANATDIVILVCAADDGVMPQTQEAVQHAQAASVQMIVAVNKIDLDGADPDRVRTELNSIGVTPEEWGGDTQFVNVSATTGEGIDDLLSAIVLLSEVEEFTAVRQGTAQGVVIESRLDRGRGPVATVLVQQGTLARGDVVLAGEYFGRVRSLVSDQGKVVSEAGPSIPVEVLGLNGAPVAGDMFNVTVDERQARQLASARATKYQHKITSMRQSSRLENMFANLGKGEKRILKLILKTDVRGSLEAITEACITIGNEEVGVQVLGSGVGGITESDVNMALTYDAMIFGFNVRLEKSAKVVAEQNSLDVRYYSVIYELLDDIKKILEDMMIPEVREEIVGTAEVRDVFHSPRFGQIAGCRVVEGTVFRHKKIRVLRDSTVIYEGELESLRRFKDDVSEVRNGLECGIGVRNYNDVREGDRIEVFDSREVARAL
ncbi:MAG: translation initiation factor IF-2 [Gammaproteobacteria bacterium]|nr:translation initiation factor IF-2 [Gammaproteobacteria bacterium]